MMPSSRRSAGGAVTLSRRAIALAALSALHGGGGVLPHVRADDYYQWSDRQTMEYLYKQTVGESWTKNTNWADPSKSVCEWAGLTCKDGEVESVEKIELSSNNLKGAVPMDRILAMKSLAVLKLDANAIQLNFGDGENSVPSPPAGSSPSLRYLDLSDCNVDSLDGLRDHITGLTDLYLSRNDLRGPFPPEVLRIPTLERLSLEFNELSGPLPDDLAELRKLTFFSASDNDFSGPLPVTIGEMSNLRYLLLRSNSLNGELPSGLDVMRLLEQIDLANQKSATNPGFTGRLPAFAELSRLRRIDLSHNGLTGQVPTNLLESADGRSFDYGFFGSNRLEGEIPSSLSHLPVENLFFEDNMISGISDDICGSSVGYSGTTDGAIATFGCNAILCEPGTFSPIGRQESADTPCETCEYAKFYGAVDCDFVATGPNMGEPIPVTPAPVASPYVPPEGTPTYDQKEIMKKLFSATGGQRWFRKENWDDADVTDACDLEGVTCDDDRDVVSLALGANNLVGTPPQELFQLPKLVSLDLSSNMILFQFDGIENAKNLERLDLSSTGLFEVAGISDATKLKDLSLASNDLVDDMPEEIFQLTNLEVLLLDYNGFGGAFPRSLESLEKLKVLSCAGCGLEGEIPRELERLTELSTLRLESNRLRGPIPPWIQDKLTKLTNLDLSSQSNKDTGESRLDGPVPNFHKLQQLRRLDLSRNSLDGDIPPDFLRSVDTGSFQVADLTSNKIRGRVHGDLSFIISKVLLADNRISDLDQALCSPGLGGAIASFGCDAVLCPPRAYQILGRQDSPNEPCKSCPDAEFYGSVTCSSDGVDDTGGQGPPGVGDVPTPMEPSPAPPPVYTPPDVPPTTDNLSSPDRTALESLYLSCGGPNWSEKTNWLVEDEPICNWYGIKCADTQQETVQSIILKSNNLVDTIPVEIYDLASLETLVLDGNSIDMDFSNIALLNKLRILDLSHTKLSSLKGIEDARSLTDLHVVATRISGEFPDGLFSLIGLERVSLDFNALSGPIPEGISALTKLEYLSAHSNSFSGEIPHGIGDLSELSFLLLQDNSLRGPLPPTLENLKKLWFLDISSQKGDHGVGLSGPLPEFDGFDELRRLDLSHNGLEGNIPERFLSSVNPENFEYADLSSNQLDGELPLILARLPVSSFFFENNLITGIDMALCDSQLGGAVGLFGCDAVLCAERTFSPMGRQVSENEECKPCPGAQFYGAIKCEDENAPGPTPMPVAAPVRPDIPGSPPTGAVSGDRAILELFYNSCGGPRWNNKEGWMDSDVKICDWFGIRCVENTENVEFILLSSNNLVGTPPVEIFKLPYLDTLILDSNAILFEFEGILNAKRLKTLDLSSTGLSTVMGVQYATGLTDLHIASNDFDGEIPREIFMLTNLEQLSLDFNHFSGRLPSEIKNLKKLKLFSCAANSLTGELPPTLEELTDLTTIRLQFNQLSGNLAVNFDRMQSLAVLDLSSQNSLGGTGITGNLPHFASNGNLRRLDLSGNSLEGDIMSDFLRNVNPSIFEFADLSNNKIKGTVPGILKPLIHNIYLEGNLISDIDDQLCSADVGGAIAEFGCDAILCPPNTYNAKGKQESPKDPCLGCNGAQYYGTMECSSTTNNGSSRSDKDILQLFYQQCGGYYWRNNQNWNKDDTSICEWFGITCAPNSETVESIIMGSNNIVRTPPKEIFELPQLKTLSLYSNPLAFSFNGIENANSLTHLYLDATGLKSIAGIGKAPSLVEVYMRFNQIQGKIPPEITEISTLKRLSFSHNSMEGPLPPAMDRLTNLEDFLGSNNKIRASLVGIRFPPSLKSLDLSGNQLTGEIPGSFLDGIPASSQISVDLTNNKLVGVVPSSLARFDQLRILLADNLLDAVSPDLCTKMAWNDGDVGKYGCNGIICPKGKSAPNGRQHSSSAPCRDCGQAPYMGSSACSPVEASQSQFGYGSRSDAAAWGQGGTSLTASILCFVLSAYLSVLHLGLA